MDRRKFLKFLGVLTGAAIAPKSSRDLSILENERLERVAKPEPKTFSWHDRRHGASAEAVIVGGQVVSINLINPGSGYTTLPEVSFS